MEVRKQTPTINKTVIELANDADIGDVFVHLNGEYKWTPRDEAWNYVMLTKTERGFELIDADGRSRGIVHLEDASGASCPSCSGSYVYKDVVKITLVCCDEQAYVGDCTGEVDWCSMCSCFGIVSITGNEVQLDTTAEGYSFKYDFQLRDQCGCEGKELVKVTLTETNVE